MRWLRTHSMGVPQCSVRIAGGQFVNLAEWLSKIRIPLRVHLIQSPSSRKMPKSAMSASQSIGSFGLFCSMVGQNSSGSTLFRSRRTFQSSLWISGITAVLWTLGRRRRCPSWGTWGPRMCARSSAGRCSRAGERSAVAAAEMPGNLIRAIDDRQAHLPSLCDEDTVDASRYLSFHVG